MARLPEGAEPVFHPHVPAAPAFRWQNLYIMAGFPRIARLQLEAVLPLLERGAAVESVSRKVGLPESAIAEALAALAADFPAVEIGSYPADREDGGYEVGLVLRSANAEALASACRALDAWLEKTGARLA